jgi:hypothetical protein
MRDSLETPMNTDVVPIAANEDHDLYEMVSEVATSPEFSHHFLLLFSAFIGVPGTLSATSRKLSLPA